MLYKVTTTTNHYYIVADNDEEAIFEANSNTDKNNIIEIKREVESGERYLMGCAFLLGFILTVLFYFYYINYFK
jgi:hypothetical protein